MARKKWIENKKQRKEALNRVKELTKNTPEHAYYMEAFKKTDISYRELEQIRKNNTFFGFTNKQQFFGELGPMLCFFVYALFNLFRSFHFESKNTGLKILHGSIISGTMFYFFWIFQQFQDFNKLTYYLMTFASAVVIVIAVSLISKYQHLYINSLKRTISRLAAFSFLHTRKDKKPEMLQMFKELSEEY